MPPSPWGVDVDASSETKRAAEQAAVATRAPVSILDSRAFNIRGYEGLRPSISAGAGVLSQTLDGGDSTGGERTEFLPLLKAGIGIEWQATQNFHLNLRYDYTQLPFDSALTPGLPEREHSLKVGVEFRF